MKKINGFTKKPHPYQIMSYIIFAGKIITYSILLIPNLESFLAAIFGSCYYISNIFLAIFAFSVTKNDPTDDVVIFKKSAEAKGEKLDSSRYEYYCNKCQSNVNDTSKHCRQCDRCAEGFDHHCKWVNNCIAKKNYNFRLFLAMIAAVAFSTMFFCITSIVYLMETNFIEIYNTNKTRIILIMIFLSLNLILFVLDLKLIILHIWLIKNKMSTFLYIMALREKKNKSKRRISKPSNNIPNEAEKQEETQNNNSNIPKTPIKLYNNPTHLRPFKSEIISHGSGDQGNLDSEGVYSSSRNFTDNAEFYYIDFSLENRIKGKKKQGLNKSQSSIIRRISEDADDCIESPTKKRFKYFPKSNSFHILSDKNYVSNGTFELDVKKKAKKIYIKPLDFKKIQFENGAHRRQNIQIIQSARGIDKINTSKEENGDKILYPIETLTIESASEGEKIFFNKAQDVVQKAENIQDKDKIFEATHCGHVDFEIENVEATKDLAISCIEPRMHQIKEKFYQ